MSWTAPSVKCACTVHTPILLLFPVPPPVTSCLSLDLSPTALMTGAAAPIGPFPRFPFPPTCDSRAHRASELFFSFSCLYSVLPLCIFAPGFWFSVTALTVIFCADFFLVFQQPVTFFPNFIRPPVPFNSLFKTSRFFCCSTQFPTHPFVARAEPDPSFYWPHPIPNRRFRSCVFFFSF